MLLELRCLIAQLVNGKKLQFDLVIWLKCKDNNLVLPTYHSTKSNLVQQYLSHAVLYMTWTHKALVYD
jgi:hypothetical protein